MQTIAGYQVAEPLHEGARTLVYRGYQHTQEQTVILKMLKEPYPPPARLTWFRREYEMTRNLDIEGVPRAYHLLNDQQWWVMVLEDFGGKSLNQLNLAGHIELKSLLELAIQTTTILAQIHQRHIIHKDINPSNMVLNPTSGQVKIIDFGIATALSQEKRSFDNPRILEGTLYYMSPEQTGRMNRAIDYRTDFYSLGVTLYELLTGQLPFPGNDMLELVHDHLARQPVPPHTLIEDWEQQPALEILSHIILKLLAKNAEDRYQSALGLRTDLATCLRILEEEPARRPPGRPSPVSFVPGTYDYSDRFDIPQKLYARELEYETLLAAFERVCQGASEMMMVSGVAGIGKSALVQEIYRPITRQRGYFIAGKFDQYQDQSPYSAIVQAFRSLVRQLLSESQTTVHSWRANFLAALEPNGQVIADVIPDIELITGPLPPVPPLPPSETQNRFLLAFQRFVNVFSQTESPLVLFLDDLQWADGASLQLIESLMTAKESRYLFFIGAYRNNEVGKDHPLPSTLKAIARANRPINDFLLEPLAAEDVAILIAETLHSDPDHTYPLAELVVAKTGGNPFFVQEFFKSLYHEGLLTFRAGDSLSPPGWHWNMENIRTRQLTENVVELMTSRLQRLSDPTRLLLQKAACLGNQFDLHTLSLVSEQPMLQTARHLEPAIQEGLIFPLEDARNLISIEGESLSNDEVQAHYVFAHDRIRQAAYTLIGPGEREAVHRHIGRLLFCNTPPEAQEERIFDIVHQLNQGCRLLTQAKERHTLAALNLQAGRRARATAAFASAFGYLKTGVELLTSCSPESYEPFSPTEHLVSQDTWESHYQLTLDLSIETAEAALLCADIPTTDYLIEVALEQSRSLLDRVRAFEVRFQSYIAQRRLLEAIETGWSVLSLLGVVLPEHPEPSDIERAFQDTARLLHAQESSDFATLPAMTDPTMLAAARTLSHLALPAYNTAPHLLPLIATRLVAMTITHGFHSEAAFAFALYGLILCGVTGDIEQGYQCGQVAEQLLERSATIGSEARTLHVINCNIAPWKEHLRETLPPLQKAYQRGVETGDFAFAALAAHCFCYHSLFAGCELPAVAMDMVSYGDTLVRLEQGAILNYHRIYHQTTLHLQGRSETPTMLRGEVYDEEEMLPQYLEQNHRTAIFVLSLCKLWLAYLTGDYTLAVTCAKEAESYLDAATGLYLVPLFCFYDTLAHLAMVAQEGQGEEEREEQRRLLERVAAHQEKLRIWFQYAPMNHQHKVLLIEAEIARIQGRDGEAREYYDQAIVLAQHHGYLNEEALAHELAGRFYLSRGRIQFARVCLHEALYTYERWGARLKVQEMEARYTSWLLSSTDSPLFDPLHTRTLEPVSSEGAATYLDLNSVIKAMQAISSDIVLETLLSNMMDIVMENVGATRGVLLLNEDMGWTIRAEGSVGNDKIRTEVQWKTKEGEWKQVISPPLIHRLANEERSNQVSLIPHSIINYAIHTSEPVVLNNTLSRNQFMFDPYIQEQRPQSILCQPLKNQGSVTGLLYLENNLTNEAFTVERLMVLKVLAAQIAISIENARLYTTLEANEEKYRSLFEDSKDAIFITTPEGHFVDLNPAGKEMFGYTSEEVQRLNARALYVKPQERPQVLQQIEQETLRDHPIRFRRKDGTIIECLMTATTRTDKSGNLLGYQGIIRDITAQKRAEQERLRLRTMERELALAHDFQQGLLPPPSPRWVGLDVVCYSQPAREIGGDFYTYDIFAPDMPSENQRFIIAVGDVSGKGMSAAMLMAICIASFRTIIHREHLLSNPATEPHHPSYPLNEFLTALSKAIASYTMTNSQNCALVYAEIIKSPTMSPDYATLRVANAGCISPIIRYAHGEVQWVDVGGYPLGIGHQVNFPYSEITLTLRKHDVLILISDGVLEASNQQGELFGFERLTQAIATAPQHDATTVLSHLQTQVETFVGGREPHDDLTIVVLQM